MDTLFGTENKGSIPLLLLFGTALCLARQIKAAMENSLENAIARCCFYENNTERHIDNNILNG